MNFQIHIPLNGYNATILVKLLQDIESSLTYSTLFSKSALSFIIYHYITYRYLHYSAKRFGGCFFNVFSLVLWWEICESYKSRENWTHPELRPLRWSPQWRRPAGWPHRPPGQGRTLPPWCSRTDPPPPAAEYTRTEQIRWWQWVLLLLSDILFSLAKDVVFKYPPPSPIAQYNNSIILSC